VHAEQVLARRRVKVVADRDVPLAADRRLDRLDAPRRLLVLELVARERRLVQRTELVHVELEDGQISPRRFRRVLGRRRSLSGGAAAALGRHDRRMRERENAHTGVLTSSLTNSVYLGK